MPRDTENAATIWRWLVPCMIVATTATAFLPALQNGFVIWDDDINFLNNPHYRGLGWTELRWMFTTFLLGHYQPLSWMSWGLDYLIWGKDPFGYHLTNLCLHSANAVLFYFISRRLLEPVLHGLDRDGNLNLTMAAACAALLFAIHPLRVESVVWITERRDVLSAHFIFWTLICYFRAAASQDRGCGETRWLVGALAFYLLSLLSKAWGMTLPMLLLILDVYPLRRLDGNPASWFGPIARKVILEKAPFVVLAVIFAILAVFAQESAGAMASWERYPLSRRIAQAFYGIAFYLWKTLWPTGLSPLYESSEHLDLLNWPYLVSAVMVIGITAVLFGLRRRWPAGLAVWVCYVALIAPVSGIAQAGPQLVADRYSYLSCLGWALLAGTGFVYLRCYCEKKRRVFGSGVLTVAVSVLIAMGFSTGKQTRVWHDTESLWRHTVTLDPNSSIARNQLGNALADRGALEEAIEQYQHALRIRPAHAGTHYNLAMALDDRGDLDGAMQHYEEAARLDPAHAHAHNNLGAILFQRGELEQAIDHFQQALSARPELAQARDNLSRALASRARTERATQ